MPKIEHEYFYFEENTGVGEAEKGIWKNKFRLAKPKHWFEFPFTRWYLQWGRLRLGLPVFQVVNCRAGLLLELTR